MKNKIEVLAFVEKNDNIKALLDGIDNLTYLDSSTQLKESLAVDDYIYPRVVIVSIEYIKDKNHNSYISIKKDLMYKGASIIIYGKNISFEARYKLYALDIKGVIDENNSNQTEILSHVIRRSNLYSATLINNSIRGIIEYHKLSDDSKELTYLLDYLIFKYNISNQDASNIRLALIFLIMAFKENKIIQTAKLLNIIFKSKAINRLFRNYAKPKSFNEKIISLVLGLNKNIKTDNYIKNLDPKLINEVQKIYNSKAIAITSYQDINFFWEQLYLVLLEKHADSTFAIFDIFLTTTYNALLNFLVHAEYLIVSIESFNDDKIIIEFNFVHIKNITIKEYADTISNSIDEIEILLSKEDENKISLIYHIKPNETTKDINTQNVVTKPEFTNNKKISAVEFLKDFEVDNEMLDDLHDNATEIKDLLYKEESLSQEALDAIVAILRKYATVLHETIEFEEIAYSLEGLALIFSNLSINEIEESKKETLVFYIRGLVDDLSSWKHHIFLDANTPDIHYLDASLLENSAEIEKFILSKEEEKKEDDSEDDLEFF